MCYYNHACEMQLKLNRWSEERTLRNYEIEALNCAQRAVTTVERKQWIRKRFQAMFGTKSET